MQPVAAPSTTAVTVSARDKTDAALDTLAVGTGGASGLYLWRRAGVRLAAALALAGAVLWRGIGARK